MEIVSTAFKHNDQIPRRHTGEGEDVSPRLEWSSPPPEAKELALICDDPDAPSKEAWVHWVLYKIPLGVHEIPEARPQEPSLTEPPGALQGKNSWGSLGYRGPLPPPGHGIHHYYFKLFALDKAMGLKPGLDKAGLLNAIKGHVIAETCLIGTYSR